MADPLSLGPLGVELLSPLGLSALGLLLPLGILYILRIRRTRVPVASTWLWTAAQRDLLAKSPWKRLEAQVPLVLQASAVVLLAVALARPSCTGSELTGQSVAIVVDTSASMGASAGAGERRIELAKRRAEEVIAGLAPGSAVMLIAAGHSARIVTPLDRDRARVLEALAAIEVEDVQGRLDDALAIAADRVRAAPGGGRVVVVTDGALATATSFPRAVPTTVLSVAEGGENTAILRSDVRLALDPESGRERLEAFVLLGAFGGAAREVFVTLREENASDVLASRRVLVRPGEPTPVSLAFSPTPGDYGQGLRIELSPRDTLPVDDVSFGRVPMGRHLPVHYLFAGSAPSPWLTRALAADPEVALVSAPWSSVSLAAADPEGLVVIEGACPQRAPARDVLVVAPPEGPCLGQRVGAFVEAPTLTAWDRADARLRFLTLDGLHLSRSRTLEVSGPNAALFRTDRGVIAADVSSPVETATLLAFDPGESDWPLSASFVLFVRNVTELARTHRGGGASGLALPGEPLRIRAPEGVPTLTLEGPAGPPRELAVRGGLAVLPEVTRVGLYRASWAGPRPGKRLYAANLASAAESDLTRRLDPASASADVTLHAPNEAPAGHTEGAFALALVALAFVVADALYLARGGRLRRLRPGLIALLGLGLAPLLVVAIEASGLGALTLVRFVRPWGTAVLALCASLVALRLRRWGAGKGPVRVALADGLVAITVLALGLSVAGLEVARPLDRLTVIVALDRSRSMELVPNAEARFDAELTLAELGMREGDRLVTVAFGADAMTEEPARARGEARSPQRAPVAVDGTDLEAAIRRALAEVPPDAAARLVLLSDGVATRGDALSAASAALGAEVPVDVVPLEQRAVADVRLVDLRAPARANEGETLELSLVTASTEATDVEVRVSHDGRLVSRAKAHIEAGEDVLRIREEAKDAGLHRYDVELTALRPGVDETGEDNAASALVRVRGPSAALVIDGDGGPTFAAKALLAAGFRVTEGTAGALPQDLAELAAFDLVVLGDVRASALVPEQLERLASYVRELGGGLLLLGGDRSFGPGGYARTPVEEIAPVSFDLKRDRRRASLAEVIAIDISGSMAATAGGRTKLELANEAAARSASLLSDGDHLGVLHVDTAPRWSAPLAPLVDRVATERAIRAVGPGGGGIYVDVALDAAYAALAPQKVSLKHVLLFADGSDAEQMAGCRERVARAHALGITTSVVALGQGPDVPELEALSRKGEGRFYLVEDATRLPAVFTEETVLATRSALVEEPFRATRGAPSSVTEGLALGDAPALGGYVVTLAKPRATVLLGAPEGDPLLATWAAGLGHVGAFTSDLDDRWGAAWLGWSGAARLVAQLGRDLARKADDPRVRLDVDALAGELSVRATAVGDDGRGLSFRRLTAHVVGPGVVDETLALQPVGAGAYAAEMSLSRPGAYVVVVRDQGTGELVATSGAVLGAGDERRPTGSDRATLGRIAELSKGVVRDTLAGLFDERLARRLAHDDVTWGLVWLSAASLLFTVTARRFALPEALTAWLARLRAGRPRDTKPAPAPPLAVTSTLLESVRTRRAQETPNEPPKRWSSRPAAPPTGSAPTPAPRTERGSATPPESPAPAAPKSAIEQLAERRKNRRL